MTLIDLTREENDQVFRRRGKPLMKGDQFGVGGQPLGATGAGSGRYCDSLGHCFATPQGLAGHISKTGHPIPADYQTEGRYPGVEFLGGSRRGQSEPGGGHIHGAVHVEKFYHTRGKTGRDLEWESADSPDTAAALVDKLQGQIRAQSEPGQRFGRSGLYKPSIVLQRTPSGGYRAAIRETPTKRGRSKEVREKREEELQGSSARMKELAADRSANPEEVGSILLAGKMVSLMDDMHFNPKHTRDMHWTDESVRKWLGELPASHVALINRIELNAKIIPGHDATADANGTGGIRLFDGRARYGSRNPGRANPYRLWNDEIVAHEVGHLVARKLFGYHDPLKQAREVTQAAGGGMHVDIVASPVEPSEAGPSWARFEDDEYYLGARIVPRGNSLSERLKAKSSKMLSDEDVERAFSYAPSLNNLPEEYKAKLLLQSKASWAYVRAVAEDGAFSSSYGKSNAIDALALTEDFAESYAAWATGRYTLEAVRRDKPKYAARAKFFDEWFGDYKNVEQQDLDAGAEPAAKLLNGMGPVITDESAELIRRADRRAIRDSDDEEMERRRKEDAAN
jgi:hypothetical protein